jgi:hypothetical protein
VIDSDPVRVDGTGHDLPREVRPRIIERITRPE